jgi:hypothetical protein
MNPDSTPAHLVNNPRFGFPLLLLCLVAALVLPPFFDYRDDEELVLRLILSVILFASLYLVAYRRREIIIGSLLIIPIMLANWWDDLLPMPWDIYISRVLYIVFITYVGGHVARFLFESQAVNLDMIYAAVCLYLLIGLAWGFIYVIIEVAYPGSFRFAVNPPAAPVAELRSLVSSFIYYSYVTLSTLGYGDITPVTRMARSWAVLETLAGQLYLAIVIARMIGLHISRKRA